jgi:hypothetical protein
MKKEETLAKWPNHLTRAPTPPRSLIVVWAPPTGLSSSSSHVAALAVGWAIRPDRPRRTPAPAEPFTRPTLARARPLASRTLVRAACSPFSSPHFLP